jgi:hypothetical protein
MYQYLRKGIILGMTIVFLMASVSWADVYDESQAGQPWRIMAYLLNPVGVTLEYLVARPLHWLMHHKSIDKLTGHSKFTEEDIYKTTKYP